MTHRDSDPPLPRDPDRDGAAEEPFDPPPAIDEERALLTEISDEEPAETGWTDPTSSTPTPDGSPTWPDPLPAPATPGGHAIALLAFTALVSALHWSWYPLFIDTYYHMAAIHGFEQAGGLPTWAFWELAPSGRVHIYPPSLHVVGYLLFLVGLPPDAFITFVSWLLFPAALLTTWLWMRGVFGPRAALATIVLLCGPGAWFWNQTTFTACAFALSIAPLALLALERERFITCGVLSLIATSAHPMGLFLPPALAINALLRGRRRLAGLTASILPGVIYLPWLVHIWANRVYMPTERTGGDVSLTGIGAGGTIQLGVALSLAALVGLVALAVRRRESLGLLGPALGFAVVFPMGFGGRFFQFNVHWPLACLGGFGAGVLLDRLDRGSDRRRSAVRVGAVGVAFLVLATWAVVEVRPPRDGPRAIGRRDRPATTQRETGPDGPSGTRWALRIGPSALAQLLVPGSHPSPFGPGGGPGASPRAVATRDPGAAARRDPEAGGRQGPRLGPEDMPRDQRGLRGAARGAVPRRRAARGPRDMELYRKEGAREFFDATRRLVAPGEIVFVPQGVAASLLTGVTGRWTTAGILRDVRPPRPAARPEECRFFARIGEPLPSPGRGVLPRRGAPAPEGFEKVFENSFGSLWRSAKERPAGAPTPATVPGAALVAMALLGALAIGLDLLLGRHRVRTRRVLAAVTFVGAAACLAPLARSAIHDLLDPPEAPVADDGPDVRGEPPPGAAGPRGLPPVPVGLPPRLRDRYLRIQTRVFEDLDRGGDPTWFWAEEDERRLRNLLEAGEIGRVERLLNGAVRRLGARRDGQG